MLKDSDLLPRLHHVLRTSDLDTATAASVRRKLEQDLGIDLADRKPYIRQQIDLFLQSHYTHDNDDDDDDDDDEDNASPEATEAEAEEENPEEDGEVDAKNTNKERHNKTPGDVKKRGGGFSKPCALSPQLQKLIGEPELARTEVVKKIWAYIKEKDLQNPNNKRKILCDEMLHDLFRVKSIDMFQMNKALSKHIWSIEEEDVPVKPSNKKKQKRRSEEEDEQKGKKQKGKGSGLVSTHPISEALVQFFGTGEIALSRAEVVKRMWGYFKKHDLQDPSDRRRILCDDKLKELFKVDSFVGFKVSKLLTAHFIKDDD